MLEGSSPRQLRAIPRIKLPSVLVTGSIVHQLQHSQRRLFRRLPADFLAKALVFRHREGGYDANMGYRSMAMRPMTE